MHAADGCVRHDTCDLLAKNLYTPYNSMRIRAHASGQPWMHMQVKLIIKLLVN